MFIVARGCAAFVTWGCAASVTWGCAPNPRRPLAGTPLPHSVAGGPRCARPGGRTPPCCHPPPCYLGLRPKPPPATRGGPHCPTPWPAGRAVRGLGDGHLHVVVPLLVTWGCAPNPRRPLAGTPSPHSVTGGPRRARPGGRTPPCCRPPPCYLGLRPKPPPATRGDPFAPLRDRRAAPCAAGGTDTSMLSSPSLLLGAAPQTPAGHSRGPLRPTP